MKENIEIVSERIKLRNLTEADASEQYAGWLNDEKTTRFLETHPGGHTVETVKNYIHGFANSSSAVLLGVFLKNSGKHIGNIKLEYNVSQNGNGVLGIMIGETSARGMGLGTEAIIACLRFAFTKLNLHRIELGVTADNAKAIACYQRIGFRLEGRRREATKRDNGYVDNLLFGMLATEFEVNDHK